MRVNPLSYIVVICSFFIAEDICAQSKVRVESFTGFSWGVNKSYQSKDIVIDNSTETRSTTNISFGAGNEFGLLLNKGFDSSNLTFSFGFAILSGKKYKTGSYFNTDSSQNQYNIMESFQASILLGLGYSKTFENRFEINTDVGLNFPIISRMREERIVELGNSYEQTTIQYRTSILPGFWMRGGVGYNISQHVCIRSNVSFTFMNLTEKRSEIKDYYSNNNQTLNNRYPTVSDRETIYYSDITKVTNDPLLFPDTFDENKPSESIKSQLPFSRLGISFSVVWNLNFEKKTK